MPPSRKTRATPLTTLIFVLILLLAASFAWLSSNKASQTVLPPSGSPTQAGTTSARATLPVQPTRTIAATQAISAWFSNPLSAAVSGGPETHLVDAMNGAQRTIDTAIYNLTIPDVTNALLNAKKRGVQVRLVMESEAMDKDQPRALQKAGIPIIGDQKQGLMHNKFTILDGREVWMGSMNYTDSSAYTDFNNLVRIISPKVVQDYQVNFDEMFVEHKFGTDKLPNTPYPQVDVDGIPVQVYFSPDDGVAQHVTAALTQAKTRIDFLAYSFTRNDFANAILARAKSGVKVRGVFDESQNASNVGGEYTTLRKAGLDVRIDGIPGLLHDKVIIIDAETVITGSYNFSANAENTNDENLVIIRSPALAALFLQHFEEVYNAAK